MRWHNLGTVVAYEFRRTIAKPTFWFATLSVPALLVAVIALSWFSGSEAERMAQQSASEPVAFTYSDASGIVDADVAHRLGGSLAPDAAAAARAVREGRSDLHVDVPADPSRDPVTATGRDIGLNESDRWRALASTLLERSVTARIGDARLANLATGGPAIHLELWRDGAPSPGWGAVIAPGAFLVLLYMAIVMLGNQMLAITVEEKENRVSEMILTMIDPTVLIAGKVVALFCVGIVQGLATLVLPFTVWAFTAAAASGPLMVGGQELTITFDSARILVAVLLFFGGYLLLTGLLVAIGAVSPTAKDAGAAFGGVILAIFVPLYAWSLVLWAPDSVVTQVLTYLPLTAPVTALIRNAVGSLSAVETVVVLAILYGTAAALLVLGARLFRTGSIAYDKRLSPAKLLRVRRADRET